MPGIRVVTLPALGLAASIVVCRADDFEIAVRVKADGREVQTQHTQHAPAPRRPASRPACHIKAGQEIQIFWQAEDTDKSAEFKEVLMHFFVVKEDAAGQRDVPKLANDAVVCEGALTMDFKPKGKASWRCSVRIPKAGSYLLRVETIGMAEEHEHERYAAMDLIVE